MRLTLDRRVDGLQATVTIDRAGSRVETLDLTPTSLQSLVYESSVAPAEPHEFSAQLRMAAGDRKVVLPFALPEPAGHGH